LSLTVGEMPDERQAGGGGRITEPETKAAPSAISALGLTVSDLTDTQKRELKLKLGVKVDAAVGLAAKAGLRSGDLLLSADNIEITSVKQFQAQMAKAEKEKVKVINLMVRRDDAVVFVLLKPARS